MRQMPWLVGVGLGVYLLIYPQGGLLALVPLEVALVALWYLFVNNTVCDFECRGGPCRNDAYGKVRGCRAWVSHRRGKRAALLDALNLSNPENAFRVTWRDSRTPARVVGSASSGPIDDAQRPWNRSQARFNLLSLVVATVGSAAGVLALFVDPGA